MRTKQGRKSKTSFLIVDSQSVKNTDTAEQKGYDAGKQVSGIKRHLFVDTQGLPHAIGITTAEVNDRNGAIELLKSSKDEFSHVKKILTDGGYSGVNFAQEVRKIIPATVEVAKRSELHQFVVMPKRWVVELSFGWLQNLRRLWRNCERKINTSLAMVQLAFIYIIIKRF